MLAKSFNVSYNLLRQSLAIGWVSDKLNNLLLYLSRIIYNLRASENSVASTDLHLHDVTAVNLNICLLLILIRHRRQLTANTFISIHCSCSQPENKQQESDISHRTGIDFLYSSICHIELFSKQV